MLKYILGVLHIYIILFTNQDSYSQNSLIKSISYHIDKTDSLSFQQIKKQRFSKQNGNNLSLGIIPNPVWVKIKIDTTTPHTNAVLELKNSLEDKVSLFFETKNNKVNHTSLQLNHSKSENPLNHITPAFEIPIKKLKTDEVYLKIESWSITFTFKLLDTRAFNNNRIAYYFVLGMTFGGLLIISVYNLFIFFSLKDLNFLLYALCLISATVAHVYITGVYCQFIASQTPRFHFSIFVVFASITFLFSTVFTIRILEISKEDKILHGLLIWLNLLPITTLVLEFSTVYTLSRTLLIIQCIILAIIIYVSSIYHLIKRKKIALYFLLAWTLYIAGIITFFLKCFGFIPTNIITDYSSLIGCLLGSTLFSFSLSHKYNLIRLEKDRLKKQTREELEKLVKLQTAELENSLEEKEILLKEIHHRVKNNLQIIISLIDLQMASITNSKNRKNLLQSKSRVYSISLIHQNLYQSDNLAKINIKEYLENLCKHLENNFVSENAISFKTTIEALELPITQATPLGLIANELITNSLKHSENENNQNYIEVDLKTVDSNIELKVKDSGKGFEIDNLSYSVKKSFGLFLIKSLTTQLKGVCDHYFKENLFVTQITFPRK